MMQRILPSTARFSATLFMYEKETINREKVVPETGGQPQKQSTIITEDTREGMGTFINLYADEKPSPQKNSGVPSLREESTLSKTQSEQLAKARQKMEIDKTVAKLKATDISVRAHEAAHMGAGGGLITSSASYTYQEGPDGRNYAVGGEVGIDSSPVSGDPRATIQKMQQVRAAALAPADPSGQDLMVAAQASATETQAQAELTAQSSQQTQENTESGGKTQQELSPQFRQSPEKDRPQDQNVLFSFGKPYA